MATKTHDALGKIDLNFIIIVMDSFCWAIFNTDQAFGAFFLNDYRVDPHESG